VTTAEADAAAQFVADDLSAAVLDGAWLDPVKFALTAAWFLLAVRIIGFVAAENHRLRLHRSVWSFAVVAGALTSLMPLLLIPFLPLGLFFAAGFFLPTLMGYVHLVRNPRVRPSEQLLTDDHFARLGRDLLAGVGLTVADSNADRLLVRIKPSRSVTRRPESVSAVGTLQTLMEDSLRVRASDLQFDVLRDRATIRNRIDGVWGPATALDLETAIPLGDVLAKLSSADGVDARRMQAGSFSVKIGRESHTIHAAVVSSVMRRRITLRLPSFSGPKKLDDLGFDERERTDVAGALKFSAGLVLVCGPPSSGRRTTLQTMVGEIEQLSRRVLAVDEPGRPFDLPNTVDRFASSGASSTDAATALRQAVNVKCDVLLVGRVESAEAASLLLQAATDRLVLAAVDADHAVGGMLKLAELAAGRDALADRLRLALGQRLPRKLCVDCREAYRPNPEALRRANLARPVGDVLYRARPAHAPDCESCHDVGYVGCAPLFESLTMTPRLRHLVRVAAGEREILLEARKEGAVSPTEAALALLSSGTTSADELRRILQNARTEKEDA
jgi:general secretion pathway protein E